MSNIFIKWPDGLSITVELLDNEVAKFYQRCIKHLQHLDLKFTPRQNPYALDSISFEWIYGELLKTDIINYEKIDPSRIKDQSYVNFLHDIFVQNYSQDLSNNQWVDIHHLIHLLEDKILKESHLDHVYLHNDIWFDYAEKSGPLITKFDRSFLKHAVSSAEPGMCYLSWSEIGKTPYQYWADGEPADIYRLCKLAKPWVFLKPCMQIALDMPNHINRKMLDFETWFEPFRSRWCEHWGLNDWQLQELSAIIPIGHINSEDIDIMKSKFKKLNYPTRITL